MRGTVHVFLRVLRSVALNVHWVFVTDKNVI